jgi:hypothetical protein
MFLKHKENIQTDIQSDNPPLDITTASTDVSDLSTLASSSPSLLQTGSIDEWQRKLEAAKVMAAQKY